ncbi:hypothetical protein TM7_0390 [candidate division TM7 genomosp. GTL1]|nr:hypothetical protein TM7_0390 [candidate division TM7 genomosp. GTL1]
MIIHLVGNATHLKEDLPYLRTIAKKIHENGDVLALNWIDPANKQDVDTNTPRSWDTVLDEHVDAVSKAELLIVEASQYRFGVGYFTAMATQNKKPTLLVSRKPLKGRSITGITDQYLTCRTYKTKVELGKVVTEFLKENTADAQDLRFNFFIDRQIYNYLRDKSYETGKSKSEIIRELLEREIDGRHS